jgi:mRNA interferase MazF
MTGFEFGDIVFVRFPFTDHSTSKQRPAAVISSAAYHRARADLVIMAVTSQIRPRLAFAEARIGHWKEAGLLKPSVIKPVIATIERDLVRRRLGRLAPMIWTRCVLSLPRSSASESLGRFGVSGALWQDAISVR